MSFFDFGVETFTFTFQLEKHFQYTNDIYNNDNEVYNRAPRTLQNCLQIYMAMPL